MTINEENSFLVPLILLEERDIESDQHVISTSMLELIINMNINTD